jgi:cyanophycinase-like exopeptidase
MQRMLASLQSKGEQAADEEVLTRLKAADIVMFTGDQLRLTSILGGTVFMIFYWISITMRNLFMLVHQQMPLIQ